MFCTQCGTATAGDARFCGNCGAPAQERSNLGASSLRPTAAPPVAQRPETSVTENETFPRKPMHLAAYLGLCIGAWIVGAVVANGISILMGSIYAEATVPTIIGFWLGKVVLKNKRRDWGGIVAFPITAFLAAIFGSALGGALASHNSGSMNYASLICLIIAFALSCGLFGVLKLKSGATAHETTGANEPPESADQLMRRYGVTRDGRYYIINGAKFEKLKYAIDHSNRQAASKGEA